MYFANPLAFIGLISIPIIILMYLLKQKPKEIIIPSVLLWVQAEKMSESYKPWQKLRFMLLLFLQIIIALLLTIALANPFIRGRAESESLLLVIDSSLSMQTLEGNQSRFQKAKQSVREIVSSSRGQVAVVVLDSNPFILYRGTDRRELNERLSELTVTSTSANFDAGLDLVRMLYRQQAANVFVYTDTTYDFAEIPHTNINMAQETENTAITLVSHSVDSGRVLCLVKVKNFGLTKIKDSVAVYADDIICDVREIELEPNEEKNIIFTNLPENTSLITARLMLSDALQADNSYYDVVQSESQKKVILITDGNVFLESIFNILPNIELFKGSVENIDNLKGGYLYIFDGVLPLNLPTDGHMLFINPPKEQELISLTEEISVNSLLLENNVSISEAEAELVTAGIRGTQKIMSIGFDLQQTDLPLKTDFPIFMYNISKWFITSSIVENQNIYVGDTAHITPIPDAIGVKIVTPQKKVHLVAPPFPIEPFLTMEQGIYLAEIETETETKYENFAVNLEVERESDIKATAGEGETQGTVLHTVESNKSLRNVFIFLALLVLALEWWVYKRGI